MKAKALTTILILTLSSTVFAQDMMTVPLYENTFPDYKESQMIRHAIKWGSFGLAPALYFGKNEIIGTPSIISSALLIPTLGMIGGYFGSKSGIKLNEKKSNDPQLFSRLYTFGHEYGFDKSFITDKSDLELYNSTRYSLVFQNRSSPNYLPKEYRAGIAWKEWANSKRNYPYYEFMENRFNLDFLFNSSGKIFQFHYGIGAGYSWGDLTKIDSYPIGSNFIRDIDGYSYYPLAGFTLNIYDYIHFRIEGKYEFSEFYREVTEFFNDPESGYLNLSFSIGTYLF